MENTSASLKYNWSTLRLFLYIASWDINIIPNYLTYETQEYK